MDVELAEAYAQFWRSVEDAVDAHRVDGDDDGKLYEEVMTATDRILEVRANRRRRGLPYDVTDVDRDD